MADQKTVEVKCGECGFTFLSGALPQNRRCKNQSPVCNSANISVVDEDPSTENGECQGCVDLLKEIEGLKLANDGLIEELAKMTAAPVTIKDLVFTMDSTDPFWKGPPLMITKGNKDGVVILEKYIQRAIGSQDTERADAATAAVAKLLGVSVKKYLADKAKKASDAKVKK
jgi:hypothetical protein